MSPERGKLVLTTKKKLQIEIHGKTFNPSQGEVSQWILDRLEEMNGKEVEFEWAGGQPKKIREVGGAFTPPRQTSLQMHRSGTRGSVQEPERSHPQSRRQGNATRGAGPTGRHFHNPYNFVPAPPRETRDPDLGDHEPVSQDQFHETRFTGRIHVQMEAITPLLVPDSESCRERPDGHKTYSLLIGTDCKPLLPPSSIRGMLRSAYEAVTNSRFGRFSYEQHSKRLAYRMEAREGLRLIPARIENGRIRLLTGTSAVGPNGKPNGPQYAAWLPRYSGNNKTIDKALRYPDGSLPHHGDEVECWVRRITHSKRRFAFWKVVKIAPPGQLGDAPSTDDIKKHGWVCITNANIGRKHDERVFFGENSSLGPFLITDEHQRKWTELIENYQEIHEEDLKNRRARGQACCKYLGPDPGQTAWSRHVYTKADRELREGTLCYVRLNQEQSDVEGLYPVMIARQLYARSPWELLDPTLRPAGQISELSPADRVFGWVRTNSSRENLRTEGPSAARGLLRVGPVVCKSTVEDAVEAFPGEGLPLAILAAPKPQQGRFYVARSPNGEAQRDGLTKEEAGYSEGKGLRGRKTYPHHRALPSHHWENPLEDRTQRRNGPWQEYRRPMRNGNEQRDSQNRSVLGWVKPGATFSFDIHVMNLSKVEVGALLWLLNLPENHFHRFGGGKPLGFGSVRLTIESCDLRTGESMRDKYTSWSPNAGACDPSEDAIASFKEAVIRAYPTATGDRFDEVSFIKAFLTACRGFDDNLPLHYPRTTSDGRPGPPSPDGESFTWFVENERNGQRHALGDLAGDKGLPVLEHRRSSDGRDQRRRNQ